MPILPRSWKYPPRLSAARSSSGQAEVLAELDGVAREALAVALRVGVARLDHQREAAQHALGGVELVGEALELHERPDPRFELGLIDRLRQEVVGAGLDGLEAVVGFRRARHQHHRNQPRRGVALDRAAEREPVAVRHADVAQDHVRARVADDFCEAVVAVDGGDDAIALQREQPLEQVAVGLEVVDDEHRSDVVAGGVSVFGEHMAPQRSGRSSTSRTVWPSAVGVNGFWMNVAPGSSAACGPSVSAA